MFVFILSKENAVLTVLETQKGERYRLLIIPFLYAFLEFEASEVVGELNSGQKNPKLTEVTFSFENPTKLVF
jgi:hypothetical protein